MLLDSLLMAVKLIFSFDSELYKILFRSLYLALCSVMLAGVLGIPLGTWLALKKFKIKSLLVKWLYVFMGLPPVFIGLLVFLFLSRSGPIGPIIYILFTPWAIIIAQALLALPIITGLTLNAVEEKADVVLMTARGLGAKGGQLYSTLIKEVRIAIIAALVTAFGRVIAEVGAVMLVGGDIEGKTRVLTTSIVLETRQGNFGKALALGIILLILSFLVNNILYDWQYKVQPSRLGMFLKATIKGGQNVRGSKYK
ncbi:MAG: ABC transporter permease [Bacillota bacterium]